MQVIIHLNKNRTTLWVLITLTVFLITLSVIVVLTEDKPTINTNPIDSFRLTIQLAVLVLGREQYEKLKTFLKNKYGRINISVMNDEILNIFKNINELKN